MTVDVSTLPVLPPSSFTPLYVTNLGDDAIDLSAVCGLFLDDWQQEILRGSLGYGSDGLFSARSILALVPRQQGKTVVLEARELAGLFLLEEKIMAHTAQEQRTAISSYRRLKDHIEYGKDVLPHFDKIRWLENTTEISVSLPRVTAGSQKREASRLIFSPRTGNALRGLTVELLIVDEGYAYTGEQAAAIEPTQNQSKNPQFWLTSSTGMPESTELIARRDMGIAGTLPSMAFYEFKADDGSDPGDKRQWYNALPGLRTGRQRISEIEAQFLKAKAAAENGTGDFTSFNREMLGLWATNDVASTIPYGVWESQKLPDPELWVAPDEFAFAVDVTPDTNGVQHASIYACGQDENGFYHVWQVGADEDILWVAEFLKIQQEQREPRVTVIDPMSPAGALMPMFDELDVQYTKLTSSQCMAAASQFLAVVRDGRIRHGDDELLNASIRGAVQRIVGQKGAWLWARKSLDFDISPLVASTYAMFALNGVEAAGSGGGWVW